MEVAVLVYDGVSAGEALAPWQVLRYLPDARCRIVAEEVRPHLAHHPGLRLDADHQLDDVSWADVLVVPGGFGCRSLVARDRLLDWIRRLHETTQWTTAVSTGSALLAAAGVLAGRQATTHWLAADLLDRFGATPVRQRVVRTGRILTAMGSAAAIEMALCVASRSGGQRLVAAIHDELAAGLGESFDPRTSPTAAAIVSEWHRRGLAPASADDLPLYAQMPAASAGGGRRNLWSRLRTRAL